MPLNATTYLERHGWRGKGVPLDGESGRGLKKPLALPMKRNLKGVGKERDRAVEWWDCLFEAGAKKLQSSPSDKPKETISTEDGSIIIKSTNASSSLSLASLAKREHARRLLMSGFVRGRPNEAYEKQVKDLEKTLAEQDRERIAAKAKLVEQSTLINGQSEKEAISLSEKDLGKAKRKEEKKLAKKLLKDTLNKKDEKSMEEKDAKKKRKREEKAAAKASSQKKIGSSENEDSAEKRRRNEEKRKHKEAKKEMKQKKNSESSGLEAEKESKKRKRSSKD
jgi:nucleolar protein TMA23